jgi:hypothetical protein
MANDEHVAMLRKGVAAWNAWRHENPDVRPDLSEANVQITDGGMTISLPLEVSCWENVSVPPLIFRPRSRLLERWKRAAAIRTKRSPLAGQSDLPSQSTPGSESWRTECPRAIAPVGTGARKEKCLPRPVCQVHPGTGRACGPPCGRWRNPAAHRKCCGGRVAVGGARAAAGEAADHWVFGPPHAVAR